jgi:hypothetical protein
MYVYGLDFCGLPARSGWMPVQQLAAPGGRMAISGIVTDKLLTEAIVCEVKLWASCICGAMQREDYLQGIEDAGLKVATIQDNPGTPSSLNPRRAPPRPAASKAYRPWPSSPSGRSILVRQARRPLRHPHAPIVRRPERVGG